MSKKSLRESMPLITEFIDECREAFGAEAINQSIRAGLDGQETFWARENGIEIGTKPRRLQNETTRSHDRESNR